MTLRALALHGTILNDLMGDHASRACQTELRGAMPGHDPSDTLNIRSSATTRRRTTARRRGQLAPRGFGMRSLSLRPRPVRGEIGYLGLRPTPNCCGWTARNTTVGRKRIPRIRARDDSITTSCSHARNSIMAARRTWPARTVWIEVLHFRGGILDEFATLLVPNSLVTDLAERTSGDRGRDTDPASRGW